MGTRTIQNKWAVIALCASLLMAGCVVDNPELDLTDDTDVGDTEPGDTETGDTDPGDTETGDTEVTCGTSDFDGDGVCDESDPCPRSAVDSCSMIEDFESSDTWPWAPWVRTSAIDIGDVVDAAAAHDGGFGLTSMQKWIYREDTTFGNVQDEVLAVWCRLGPTTNEKCGLGFGADATGTFGLYLETLYGVASLIHHDYSEMWTDGLTEYASTTVQLESDAWYLLEVHVSGNGVFDGQIYEADGVTPVASVSYDLGPLPGTGVALYASSEVGLDSLQVYQGDGRCVDIDGDSVCDADDLCAGDDATGDDDTDGICNDNDICIGLDLLGDADGDGDCDQAPLDTTVPAFYDQTATPQGWVAGGVCVEKHGAAGLPACEQTEWQAYIDDIAYIVATYDWTNAIFDAQTGGYQSYTNSPYILMCSGFEPGPDSVHYFDDLNAMYHGTARPLFGGNFVFNEFLEWNVNVWGLFDAYHARAQMFGGICEIDNLVGAPTGFHASDLGSDPWIQWEVRATEDCDFYGCRCDATAIFWSDLSGIYDASHFIENIFTNDTQDRGLAGEETPCTDSRFGGWGGVPAIP